MAQVMRILKTQPSTWRAALQPPTFGGQSNLLLIRRFVHSSTLNFNSIRGRFFVQVSHNVEPKAGPPRTPSDTGLARHPDKRAAIGRTRATKVPVCQDTGARDYSISHKKWMLRFQDERPSLQLRKASRGGNLHRS